MAGKCGCNGTCNCAAASTTSITHSGTGAADGPFRSVIRRNPAAWNLLGIDDDGVGVRGQVIYGPDGGPLNPNPGDEVHLPAACVLDYNGDPITPDADGCVQLPTAGVPPAFGCGLKTQPDGVLRVSTSGSWPPNDLAGSALGGSYTNGGAVMCGLDGKLRTTPEHTTVNVAMASSLLDPTLATVTSSYISPSSPALTIVNPSPSRRLTGVAFLSLVVDLVAPALSTPVVRLQSSSGGGGWLTEGGDRKWPCSDAAGLLRSQMEIAGRVRLVALAPGASWSVMMRSQIVKTGPGGDPVAVEIRGSIQFLGSTI